MQSQTTVPVAASPVPQGSLVSRRLVLVLCALLFVGSALLSGCRRGEAQSPQVDSTIRAAKPTFTPTPSQPVAAQPMGAQVATPQPQDDVQVVAQSRVPTGAKAVINTPLVNVRTAPGLDSEVVTIVERGQEFDILAKDSLSEWWQICCVDDEAVWVIGQLVDTIGDTDVVPFFGQQVTAQTAAAAVPTNIAASGAVDIQFTLTNQERFPESGLVRIFLFVYEGTQGLAGYTLNVQQNGVDLPVNTLSFGGQPGFTWPFQDARQRSQNWKTEFPNIDPAGEWVVQLMDGTGQLVGPPATFAIAPGDTDLELYVRYERQ